MKRSKLLAIFLAAAVAINPVIAFAFAPGPGGGGTSHSAGGNSLWWFFACPSDIIAAAMVKNWKRHKELTKEEAWTCGLLYWYNEATGKYERRR
jgi:hypothetical protein